MRLENSFCRFLQNFHNLLCVFAHHLQAPFGKNFKIYVARSPLASPLGRLGSLRPLLSCDVASVVSRQLATAAPALGLRLGTRCFFPPQCTCRLRCARAPLGGVQGLFYQKETIQRPRTNANGTKRIQTRLKWKSEKRRPVLIGVINLQSRDFFSAAPFR